MLSPIMMQVVASQQVRYEEAKRAIGPVGYWRLSEAAGTTANEDTGFYDLTYVNTPTLGANPLLFDQGDTSVLFASASSEYADRADAVALRLGSEMTLLAWFVSSTDANQFIFGKDEDPGNDGYQMQIDVTSDALRVFIDDGATAVGLNGNTNVHDGVIHFVAFTLSGGTGRIYIDGVLQTSVSMPTPEGNAARFNIGRRNITGLFFDGRIGQAAILDYELSAGLIEMFWQIGSGRQVSRGDSW